MLAFLTAACPVWLSGCAHTPPPVSDEVRATFGRVAVISCGETPKGEFYSPTSGKGAGAAKGSVAGMAVSIAGGLEAGGIGVVLGLLLTPVGALAGAVYGAVEAEPKSKVDASAAAIDRALANTYLGNEIQNRVVEEVVEKTDYEVALVDFDCPTNADIMPDYRPLAGSGVTTVIEIEVEDFGFEDRGAEIDPEINLDLTARVRLINTKDGRLLYERSFKYTGEKRKYATWAHNDAFKLRKEIGRACGYIAKKVVREIFIAKSPSAERGSVIEKPSILTPRY